MQQEDSPPIRLAIGRRIHIGHAQRLALMHDRQHVEGIGVGEAFERDAEGLLRRRGRRRSFLSPDRL